MFAEDLPEGKRHEAIVLEIIKLKYPRAYMTEGLDKSGDIVVPELNMMVEVKYDRMSQRTGNFFFEIECNGEPSGLKTTASTWWVIMDDNFMYWVEINALWDIIKQTGRRPVVCKNRENGETDVTGYLVAINRVYNSPYVKVMPYEN